MALSDLYMGDLLYKLITHETGNVSYVTYRAQKPSFAEGAKDLQAFVRSSPEAQGLSHTFLKRLITRLHNDPACKMHKLMVIKDSVCIAEEAFGPYPLNYPHVTHSMCKSITGMAIGLLIDEGKLTLDENVYDIFGQQKGIFDLLKPRNLTVRHLLTMTSGVQFNEAGVLTGDDWKKSFLQAPFNFTPGSEFEYNSMNSYMLSAIITEKTGMTMAAYLKDRLFDPMGFTTYLWEESPQGITKGGWGMYLRIEDMCKAGQLYLQKGIWNGKQLIPEDWVAESVKVHASGSKGKLETADDYGYHLWTSADREGAFTYNGMLGQNVYCYPDVQMIIATNAANDDIFQTGNMSRIIRQMMKEELDDALIKRVAVSSALTKSTSGFSSGAIFPEIMHGGWRTRARRMSNGTNTLKASVPMQREKVGDKLLNADALCSLSGSSAQTLEALMKALNGRVYDTEVKGIGVLPLLVQVFRINFTAGIRAIGFRYTAERDFYIDFYEGKQVISLLCNFHGSDRASRIDVNGEQFLLTVRSKLTRDASGNLLFTNALYFADESSKRRIDLTIPDVACNPLDITAPKRFRVTMNEDPGSDMLIQSMKMVTGDKQGTLEWNENMSPVDLLLDGTKALLKESLRQIGAIDTLKRTIADTVAPCFTARLREEAMKGEGVS